MAEEDIGSLKRENEELKKKVDELKSKIIGDNYRGQQQKEGMVKKASQGNFMSRVPFGYKMENKKLAPAENFKEVEEIFEKFLNENLSLTQLAKKHNFSVNGLKKILTNFVYIGKVKFDNQIHEGNHKPIISSTLFNHVQNKLERLRMKNKE